MNNERKFIFGGPSHLTFESLQLLLLVCSIPIKVKSHLADTHEAVRATVTAVCIKQSLHLVKHLRPIVTHLFRVQAHHRIAQSWIVVAHGRETGQRGKVYARHNQTAHTCLTGPRHDSRAICIKLLAIEMGMGIYDHSPNRSDGAVHHAGQVGTQFSLAFLRHGYLI